jgi:hypothetical protein
MTLAGMLNSDERDASDDEAMIGDDFLLHRPYRRSRGCVLYRGTYRPRYL